MQCPQCGKEISSDSRFCQYCGAKTEFSGNISRQGFEQTANNVYSGNNPAVQNQKEKPLISAKVAAILAYITWIGWVVAFVCSDRKDKLLRFHLNQALVLNIASLILTIINRCIIGTIARYALMDGAVSYALISSSIFGGIITIFEVIIFVVWLISFISAVQGKESRIPVLSDIKILK